MNRRFVMIAVLLLTFSASNARAAPVLYHGFLTNARGEPLSGSFQMTFTLFDAATGGTNRWTETVTTMVEVGNFAVVLGQQTPLTADLFAGPSLHLSVQVDSQELPSRQMVGAVPLSLMAEDTLALGGRSLSVASCNPGQALVLGQGQWVCADVGAAGGGLPAGCANGDSARWNGSTWTCATPLSQITAGTGLTGGTITDTGTIAINTSVVPRLGSANTFTAGQTIQSGAAGDSALVVRGASGQTANLQEWQSSAGTAVASVSAGGTLQVSGFNCSGCVAAGEIGTGAVTNSKLGTGAVTSVKLGTGAVTSVKMASPVRYLSSNGGSSDNHTQSCTSGKLIGGGCSCPGGFHMRESRPQNSTNPTYWYCRCSGTANITAYALCIP